MLKDQFPIFKKHPDLVYLDSAASALKPQSVIDAVNNYYMNFSVNSHRAIYDLGEDTTELVEEARQQVAGFLKVKVDEIAFTNGATHGLNLMHYGFLKNVAKNSKVVILESEHHSNLLPAQKWCQEFGLQLKVIPLSRSSKQIQEAILAELDSQTVLLAMSLDSNVLPLEIDYEKVIKACNGLGIKVFVDACQTVAHRELDLVKLKVDALVFSGHKMYGPTGIGVLYIKQNLIDKVSPLIVGGGMIEDVSLEKVEYVEYVSGIKKFEAGTLNLAGIFGLSQAVKFIQEIGYQEIQRSEQELFNYLLKALNELDFIETYPQSPINTQHLLALNMQNVHAHDVAMILNQEGVCVRAGKHCTQLLHDRLGINASIRISLGVYNQISDIDKLIEALKKADYYFNSRNG